MSTNPTLTVQEPAPPRSTPSTLVLTIDLSECVLPADFNGIATLIGGFVEGTRQLMKDTFPGAIAALNLGEHTDWLLQRFYAQMTSEGHRQSKAIAAAALKSSTTTPLTVSFSVGQK